MPTVNKPSVDHIPQVHHVLLKTTFCGVAHDASAPEIPIHQFRGIKYATVPARFRQSRLFTSYPPITNASCYGSICPQPVTKKSLEEECFGLTAENTPIRENLKHDEFECLNLNITCPAGLTAQSRLPVMLWLHGGSDRGSGSSWVYNGGAFVRKSIEVGKPVILVTINFRIGLFGFAACSMIRDDNKAAGDEGVGNYGLRDQQVAMHWLRHFIGGFGGDPFNITLFGENSGAADVICHLLSAANEDHPMIQRAIVQSAVFDHNLPDMPCASWQLSRAMASLRVSTIEQFRTLDACKLVGLCPNMRAIDDGHFFRPGWKDHFSPEEKDHRHHRPEHVVSHPSRVKRSPSATRSSSRARSSSRLRSTSIGRRNASAVRSRSRPPSKIPLLDLPETIQPVMIGDCAADAQLWSYPVSLWSYATVSRRLKAVCQSPVKASNIMRAYDISPHASDEEIVERVMELVNDARVAWPTECVANSARRKRHGLGVYRYVFDQEGPIRGVPHHAADLMYLFDNVPLPESAFATNISEHDLFCDGPFDELDDEEEDDADIKYRPIIHDEVDGDSDDWVIPPVDEYSYARVKNAMQERWIAFANGDAPWNEDKVYVFGPEGETGERSKYIFEGRRRKQMWVEAFEPLGMQLVQQLGMELSRGPPVSGNKLHC